jgi:FtsP/CotA-like multicopper oxidase with cupredoxin domain
MLPAPILSRRRALLLTGAAALTCAAGLVPRPAAAGPVSRELVAKRGRVQLVGRSYPKTKVWGYDGLVPGPELRVRQGERLTVAFDNRLPQASTVHWHGLRIANAMDGVPDLTQPAVAPGESFTYSFVPPDAGTHWYHPHTRAAEQVGRGLYGALIVEEREPIQVDRELVWMLDDWRMNKKAGLVGGFDDRHDRSHAGRIGNTVTVNGVIAESEPVRAGERIRLRLINAANARFFALDFAGHKPQVIALDGQPCEPHEPPGGRVLLGPAMRADLVIDMAGRPGEKFTVTDSYYKKSAYRLLDLAYAKDRPLRESPLDAPIRLPANPLPAPGRWWPERHEMLLEGGAMGGLSGANMTGRLMSVGDLNRKGKFWALNGETAAGHKEPPLLTFERGQTAVIEIFNDSFFEHPMHLHGHSFRVLKRDGQPVPHEIWQDTVIVSRQQRVEIAFVADNPGDWMFHCHILEHQEAGMMGVVRVT